MNRAPFNYDETDLKNMQHYAVMEQYSNNNIDNNHNEMQGEGSIEPEKKQQLLFNDDRGNSNKQMHRNNPNGSNQYGNRLIIYNRECALNRLFTFGSYLISPIEEYRGKESAFTPLKNESLFLLSSSNKRDIQSSFESIVIIFNITCNLYLECEFSLSKKEESLIHGTCLNFNNIEISPEVSDNEAICDNIPQEENQNLNQMILSNNTSNNYQENKIQCTCTKTNCKKKYCACYANGKYCNNCQCKNCENKGMNIDNEKNKLAISIICNCTKSNCTKKYCECFKNGIECSSLCRCINCVNSSFSAVNVNHQQVMNIKEYSTNSLMYSIEEIRIEIRNNIMRVQKRGSHYCHNANVIKPKQLIHHSNKRKTSHQYIMNETYTPMKTIGKKRGRSKIESTNIKTPGLLSSNKNTRSYKRSASNKKKLDL